MTTIKIFTRTLVPTLALLFSLNACGGAEKADKKASDKKAEKAVDKADDKAKAPDVEPEVAVADVPALDPKVEKAVTLANQLAAEPGRADAILEEAGLDRDAFQKMLYEIAGDPELSKSYAVAREA